MVPSGAGTRKAPSARGTLNVMTDHEPFVFDDDYLADPYAALGALRRTGAVHRAVSPDGAPLWLVTGYDEVRAAAMDPRLSLNKRHAGSVGSAGGSMPPELDAHLLNTDPPRHTRLRGLVNGAFTPRRTQRLAGRVHRATDALLDDMAERGTADIVGDFAMPLSMTVICELLGIAADDRPDFRAWTDTLLGGPDSEGPRQSRQAMRAMHRYLVALIGDKRRCPADDLLSALITARDVDDRLDDEELVAMAFLLLFGGYHNSAGLIATTVLALVTHPRYAAAVRDGTLAMDAVTDEALRWNSPSMLAVRRFATCDVELGGTVVRAGERVWLSWASANRDPARYDAPGTFDPCRTRARTGHVAFGHGVHYCPGAALARLENEIAVTSLLDRFPRLRLGQAQGAAIRWKPSLRSRTLAALHVTV
jgi:cytochrome P450